MSSGDKQHKKVRRPALDPEEVRLKAGKKAGPMADRRTKRRRTRSADKAAEIDDEQ